MVQKVAPASPSHSFLTSIVSNKIVQLGLASIAAYFVFRFIRSLVGGRATLPKLPVLSTADQTAMKLYAEGLERLKEGNRVGALSKFQQADGVNPTNPNLRAGIFLRLGDGCGTDYDKAVFEYTRAMGCGSSDKTLLIEAHISRARNFIYSRRWTGAGQDLADAWSHSPTESEKIQIMLCKRLMNPHCEEPEEVKLPALHPKRHSICALLIEIAKVYISKKELILAKDYLQLASNTMPLNNGYYPAEILFNQGRIFLLNAHIPEAIASFEKAQQCEHTEQNLKSKIAAELEKLNTK